MIDINKVIIGDFVVITEDYYDYAKKGEVFQILTQRIPNERTCALGTKIDLTTGEKIPEKYKLPHDKIGLISRQQLADVFKPVLAELEAQRGAVDSKCKLIEDRVRNILNTRDTDEEIDTFMRAVFH